MVKKTFKQLRDVDMLVGVLFKIDPLLESSKFGYYWRRFADKVYIPYLKEFQHQINDARIDNALEDKDTKEILRDKENPRGYKYSKEGEKKVIAAENSIKEIWDVKEVEFEPMYIPKEYVPIKHLNENQMEVLSGILIAEEAE